MKLICINIRMIDGNTWEYELSPDPVEKEKLPRFTTSVRITGSKSLYEMGKSYEVKLS